MTPKNFPNRVNRRRIDALARMQATLAIKSPGCWMELTATQREAKRASMEADAARLGNLVRGSRRAERSKKFGGRIARIEAAKRVRLSQAGSA